MSNLSKLFVLGCFVALVSTSTSAQAVGFTAPGYTADEVEEMTNTYLASNGQGCEMDTTIPAGLTLRENVEGAFYFCGRQADSEDCGNYRILLHKGTVCIVDLTGAILRPTASVEYRWASGGSGVSTKKFEALENRFAVHEKAQGELAEVTERRIKKVEGLLEGVNPGDIKNLKDTQVTVSRELFGAGTNYRTATEGSLAYLVRVQGKNLNDFGDQLFGVGHDSSDPLPESILGKLKGLEDTIADLDDRVHVLEGVHASNRFMAVFGKIGQTALKNDKGLIVRGSSATVFGGTGLVGGVYNGLEVGFAPTFLVVGDHLDRCVEGVAKADTTTGIRLIPAFSVGYAGEKLLVGGEFGYQLSWTEEVSDFGVSLGAHAGWKVKGSPLTAQFQVAYAPATTTVLDGVKYPDPGKSLFAGIGVGGSF